MMHTLSYRPKNSSAQGSRTQCYQPLPDATPRTRYQAEEYCSCTRIHQQIVEINGAYSGLTVRNYTVAYPYIPALKLPQTTTNNSKEQFNVLLFAISNVSRPHFVRNLPRTYEFLTKTLRAVVLQKYNKIAGRTFKNMVAALTGRKALSPELRDSSHRYCWNSNLADGWYKFPVPIV